MGSSPSPIVRAGLAASSAILLWGCAGGDGGSSQGRDTQTVALVPVETTCARLLDETSGPSLWVRAARVMASVDRTSTPSPGATEPIAVALARLAVSAEPDLRGWLQRMVDAVEAPTLVVRTDFTAARRKVTAICNDAQRS
jgi:hypothetical protein